MDRPTMDCIPTSRRPRRTNPIAITAVLGQPWTRRPRRWTHLLEVAVGLHRATTLSSLFSGRRPRSRPPPALASAWRSHGHRPTAAELERGLRPASSTVPCPRCSTTKASRPLALRLYFLPPWMSWCRDSTARAPDASSRVGRSTTTYPSRSGPDVDLGPIAVDVLAVVVERDPGSGAGWGGRCGGSRTAGDASSSNWINI